MYMSRPWRFAWCACPNVICTCSRESGGRGRDVRAQHRHTAYLKNNARYTIHRQGQRRTRARTMRDTQFTARVKGTCAHAQCTIRNSPPGSKAHAHTQCAIHNSPPGSKACVRTHNARYTIHNVQRGPKHCSVYDVCCSVSYTIRNAQCTTLVKIHHWYFTHKKATHARYLNSPCKPHLT